MIVEPKVERADARDSKDESVATINRIRIDRVGQWIGNHPQLALGSAVCVGVLIGWLVKRK